MASSNIMQGISCPIRVLMCLLFIVSLVTLFLDEITIGVTNFVAGASSIQKTTSKNSPNTTNDLANHTSLAGEAEAIIVLTKINNVDNTTSVGNSTTSMLIPTNISSNLSIHHDFNTSHDASGVLPTGETAVRPRISIVTRLTGQTCNWLLKIAKAKSIQFRLERLGIDSDIKYFAKRRNKCTTCIRDILGCFPNITGLQNIEWTKIFPYGRAVETNRQTWFQERNLTLPAELKAANGGVLSKENEYKALQSLQRALQQNSPALYGSASQPAWLTNGFADAYDYAEFYEELRSYLHFDTAKCCKLKPGPDTSVFHFRGFSAEDTPEKSKAVGRQELSPHQVATALFTSEPPKEVAIVSMLNEDSTLIQGMIGNFTAASTNVTFIHQSAPTEDFCYLIQSRKELIGMGYSTFFRVAGLLAVHEPTVRVYCLDSNKDNCSYFEFPTNASLQARYQIETYPYEAS